ncbi:hypothetical protein ACWOBD_07315 [Gemella morbillorum]
MGKKDEFEIENLMKNFEKMTRIEGSVFYTKYFTDEEFANILLVIARKYPGNKSIIIDIITALGMMITRYKLNETEEMYTLMLEYSSQKGISAYVAIYLPFLEGFEKHPNHWEYYMSMRKMTPKKIAQQKLVGIIEQNINNIPEQYKGEIIHFLKERHDAANNDFGKKVYLEMIEKIK